MIAWNVVTAQNLIVSNCFHRKDDKDGQLMAAQAFLRLGEVGAESGMLCWLGSQMVIDERPTQYLKKKIVKAQEKYLVIVFLIFGCENELNTDLFLNIFI